MPIKTEIKSMRMPEKKPKYPCVMQAVDGDKVIDLIVMFSAEKEGVTLFSSMSLWEVGRYYDNWRMVDFKPFIGELTIISED